MRRRKPIALTLIICLIANFFIAAPAGADTGPLQNVGDLISLGANTIRELQEAIKVAGVEVRETLVTLSNEIKDHRPIEPNLPRQLTDHHQQPG